MLSSFMNLSAPIPHSFPRPSLKMKLLTGASHKFS